MTTAGDEREEGRAEKQEGGWKKKGKWARRAPFCSALPVCHLQY